MEPRIYRLASQPKRPVSPTISEWSPIVLNPSNRNNGGRQPASSSEVEESHLHRVIHRSFAFDEWDNDDDNDIIDQEESIKEDESRTPPREICSNPSD